MARASKLAKVVDVAEAPIPGRDFGMSEEIEKGSDVYDPCPIVPG